MKKRTLDRGRGPDHRLWAIALSDLLKRTRDAFFRCLRLGRRIKELHNGLPDLSDGLESAMIDVIDDSIMLTWHGRMMLGL